MSAQHQQLVHEQCSTDVIECKFISPRSQHFGGLWEDAVKVAKYHFHRAVVLYTLTFDELRTLICQISPVKNSRPICPISEDLDDLNVLTPGNFLVGGPLVSIAEPNLCNIDENR